ncbi:hypothetical protein DXA02_11115 [Ruminococcus sp. AM54-1NS]|jgi:hypothetical protein|nr:hypothetical protein DXA02_11115 [Ruminococcus sp. AM54-1NS]
MTNHKIKDYHKNRLAFEVIVKNYEMLCTVLIVLNKEYPKTFYPKACRKWIDDFADNCKIANEWDKDGVYAYKMQQACESYGIDQNMVVAFVERECEEFNFQNRAVLADNVKLALVQTAAEYGIGEKRMKAIQKALLDTVIKDPREQVKALGIDDYVEECSVGQVDIRKFRVKDKVRTTLQEQKETAAGLEAFRRWSAENVKEGAL